MIRLFLLVLLLVGVAVAYPWWALGGFVVLVAAAAVQVWLTKASKSTKEVAEK